jgi:23S rRNA (cytidine1920-2'-O)/16S rRNA (cytidine1409-2'-O)-methyltransferase
MHLKNLNQLRVCDEFLRTNGSKVRIRLDQLLVEQGLVSGRDRARAFVLAREVAVDGVTVAQPSMSVWSDSELTLIEKPRYVSRGGDKLAHALLRTAIEVKGKSCLDIGASTGGFTDCLLQNGAAHVFAVDVGYGELHMTLRNDQRVTIFERTNARNLPNFDKIIEFAVMDVSFISVKKILPSLFETIRPEAEILVLVKPQFEANRSEILKGGVVRDSRVHARTVVEIGIYAMELGLRINGIIRSPLKGPAGNMEFFLRLSKPKAEPI